MQGRDAVLEQEMGEEKEDYRVRAGIDWNKRSEDGDIDLREHNEVGAEGKGGVRVTLPRTGVCGNGTIGGACMATPDAVAGGARHWGGSGMEC